MTRVLPDIEEFTSTKSHHGLDKQLQLKLYFSVDIQNAAEHVFQEDGILEEHGQTHLVEKWPNDTANIYSKSGGLSIYTKPRGKCIAAFALE